MPTHSVTPQHMEPARALGTRLQQEGHNLTAARYWLFGKETSQRCLLAQIDHASATATAGNWPAFCIHPSRRLTSTQNITLSLLQR